jgi:hypothetical protein
MYEILNFLYVLLGNSDFYFLFLWMWNLVFHIEGEWE